MKVFLFLCTLLAVLFCFMLNSRLEQAEARLATMRGRITATDAERVPRLDLESTQNDLNEAEKRILALEDDLKSSQSQVAALNDRVAVMESQPNLPHPVRPRPPAKPGLIKGGYRLLDDNMVYLTDSQYRLGDDLFVTSPKGMMMSDKDQVIFGGDLVLQTPQGTIQGDDAVLEIKGDNATLTAKQVTVTLHKSADSAAAAAVAGR